MRFHDRDDNGCIAHCDCGMVGYQATEEFAFAYQCRPQDLPAPTHEANRSGAEWSGTGPIDTANIAAKRWPSTTS